MGTYPLLTQRKCFYCKEWTSRADMASSQQFSNPYQDGNQPEKVSQLRKRQLITGQHYNKCNEISQIIVGNAFQNTIFKIFSWGERWAEVLVCTRNLDTIIAFWRMELSEDQTVQWNKTYQNARPSLHGTCSTVLHAWQKGNFVPDHVIMTSQLSTN
jgi:hypothetical protein